MKTVRIKKQNTSFFCKTIEIEFQLENIHTTKLITELTKNLDLDTELENLKGKNDQLVLVSGKCLDKNFTFKISSSFLKYTNDSKIIHKCIKKTSGALNEFENDITFLKLLKWLPIEIKEIQLSFDIYKKAFFGSMISSVPTVRSKFYFECKNNFAKVKLESSSAYREILKNFLVTNNYSIPNIL